MIFSETETVDPKSPIVRSGHWHVAFSPEARRILAAAEPQQRQRIAYDMAVLFQAQLIEHFDNIKAK